MHEYTRRENSYCCCEQLRRWPNAKVIVNNNNNNNIRRLVPCLVLAFVFLATINGAYSHDATDSLLDSRLISKKDVYTDTILCRRCGATLAQASDIINHLSPQATVIPNQKLFERKGVDIQVLKNSFNVEFNTITTTVSECVPANDNWYTEDNWYPGYAWKPCICPRCRTYHGWVFDSVGAALLNTNYLTNKAFSMLKLHNLASQKFVDSLLVTPKSYIS